MFLCYITSKANLFSYSTNILTTVARPTTSDICRISLDNNSPCNNNTALHLVDTTRLFTGIKGDIE